MLREQRSTYLSRSALLRGGRPRPHTLVHSIWDQLSSPTTLSPFGGLHLPDLPAQ